MKVAKNKNVKKANIDTEYTYDQIQEMAKCADDPVYFIEKYVRVQHPTRGSIPFILYDFQRELIKSYHNHKSNIVLSARQTGKTATSCAYILWFSIFNEDTTTLCASNKNAGAMEIIHRIKYAYEELPHWLKPGVPEGGWNKHSIAFDNKSRIESTATSENSGRGMSISLLYVDEFAFVAPAIQQEFWASISPTLSTGGKCIISSTPNGDADLFAQLWRTSEQIHAANDESFDDIDYFIPTHIEWDQPPGRDEKFKQEQISKVGEAKWRQEYLCEFLSSDPLLIDSQFLSLQNPIVQKYRYTLINEFRFWEQLKPRNTYIVGVDPSGGTGNDFSVVEVFHFPSLVQVAEYRTNTMSSPELYKKVKWLIQIMETQGCMCYFTAENNGVGEGFLSLYMNDDTPPALSELVTDKSGSKFGMNTNVKTKIKSCMSFKRLFESGKVRIKSKILLNELKNYVRSKGSYNANTGATDDCISALLLVVRILECISNFEDAAFDTLYSFEEDPLYGHGENDKGIDQDPLPFIF